MQKCIEAGVSFEGNCLRDEQSGDGFRPQSSSKLIRNWQKQGGFRQPKESC